MSTCDECGKRIAKDLQICLACYKKYLANRVNVSKIALDECKRALNIGGANCERCGYEFDPAWIYCPMCARKVK